MNKISVFILVSSVLALASSLPQSYGVGYGGPPSEPQTKPNCTIETKTVYEIEKVEELKKECTERLT